MGRYKGVVNWRQMMWIDILVALSFVYPVRVKMWTRCGPRSIRTSLILNRGRFAKHAY